MFTKEDNKPEQWGDSKSWITQAISSFSSIYYNDLTSIEIIQSMIEYKKVFLVVGRRRIRIMLSHEQIDECFRKLVPNRKLYLRKLLESKTNNNQILGLTLFLYFNSFDEEVEFKLIEGKIMINNKCVSISQYDKS